MTTDRRCLRRAADSHDGQVLSAGLEVDVQFQSLAGPTADGDAMYNSRQPSNVATISCVTCYARHLQTPHPYVFTISCFPPVGWVIAVSLFARFRISKRVRPTQLENRCSEPQLPAGERFKPRLNAPAFFVESPVPATSYDLRRYAVVSRRAGPETLRRGRTGGLRGPFPAKLSFSPPSPVCRAQTETTPTGGNRHFSAMSPKKCGL